MSGGMVRDALQERFDTVWCEELERVRRKLGGLSGDDRASAEMVIATVIGALARPAERLVEDPPHPGAIDAIVHLFALDASSPSL